MKFEQVKNLQEKINKALNDDGPITNELIYETDKAIKDLEKEFSMRQIRSNLIGAKQNIKEHNIEFALKYYQQVTKSIIGEDEEIEEWAKKGYILIGYKGTEKTIAESFVSKIDYDKYNSSNATTGSAIGAGLYTSPRYKLAKDFAEVEVIKKASEKSPELKEPEPPEDMSNLSAQAKYMRMLKSHENALKIFKNSAEFTENIAILRIYVNNFFSLKGLTQEGNHELPDNWQEFDYLEGVMHGGGDLDWEIKFNHKREVFDNLKATISKAEDKDLLNGKNNMLEAYRFNVSKSVDYTPSNTNSE